MYACVCILYIHTHNGLMHTSLTTLGLQVCGGSTPSLMSQTRQALETLEEDFIKFCNTGDKQLVDSVGLTSNIRQANMVDRIAAFARLQIAMAEADPQKLRVLNFYEFMHLCFVLAGSGSYQEFSKSPNSAAVKRFFMDIHRRYK